MDSLNILFLFFRGFFFCLLSLSVFLCSLFPFILFVQLLFDGPPQTKTKAEKEQNSETNKKGNVNVQDTSGTCQSNHIDVQKTEDSTPPALSASSQNKTCSVPEVAVTTVDGQIQGAKVVTILTDPFA